MKNIFAGAIFGAVAVLAFQNRSKIKSAIKSGVETSKEGLENAKDYVTQKYDEVKTNIEQKCCQKEQSEEQKHANIN